MVSSSLLKLVTMTYTPVLCSSYRVIILWHHLGRFVSPQSSIAPSQTPTFLYYLPTLEPSSCPSGYCDVLGSPVRPRLLLLYYLRVGAGWDLHVQALSLLFNKLTAVTFFTLGEYCVMCPVSRMLYTQGTLRLLVSNSKLITATKLAMNQCRPDTLCQ